MLFISVSFLNPYKNPVTEDLELKETKCLAMVTRTWEVGQSTDPSLPTPNVMRFSEDKEHMNPQ